MKTVRAASHHDPFSVMSPHGIRMQRGQIGDAKIDRPQTNGVAQIRIESDRTGAPGLILGNNRCYMKGEKDCDRKGELAKSRNHELPGFGSSDGMARFPEKPA
jgi:hypothetical protein